MPIKVLCSITITVSRMKHKHKIERANREAIGRCGCGTVLHTKKMVKFHRCMHTIKRNGEEAVHQVQSLESQGQEQDS